MRTSRSGGFRVSVLVAASLVVLTDAAVADVEEVVVTARKRSENLQDVPMVITAISAASMERKGITDLSDIAKYSSGVLLDQGFNRQDTRVVIRGLSPTRGRQNVAILQDDVDISSLAQATAGGSFVINPQLMDIERVEVVKGPHSALFGRSAFNGAIHYITKKPGDEFRANAQLDLGSYSKFEGRGSISGPVVEDKLSLGFNVSGWGSDGFYKSAVTGASLGGGNGWGAALTGQLWATDNLTFNLRWEQSGDDFEPDAASFRNPSPVAVPDVVFQTINGLAPILSNVPAVISNLANRTFPQSVGSMGNASDFARPAPSRNPLTGSDYPGSTRDINRTTLRGDWELGPVTLTSISHYGDNHQFVYADALNVGDFADPAVNGAQITYFDTDIRLLSQEFRLQSNTDGRFSWTLGALHWAEKFEQLTRASRCAAESGGCVRVYQTIGDGAKTPEDVTQRNTHHTSEYGLVQFEFTDKFSASAELRYTKEKENTFAPSVVNPGAPLGCVNVTTAGRTVGANGLVTCAGGAQTAAQMRAQMTTANPTFWSVESSYTTPRVAFDYKIAPGKMIFASVSEGKKPGGLSTLNGILNPANNTYEPEELTSYEIGAKTSWLDSRLQLNGAIYYQDYSKKQVSITFVNPASNPPGSARDARCQCRRGRGEGLRAGCDRHAERQRDADRELHVQRWQVPGFHRHTGGRVGDLRAAITNPNACQVVQVLVGTAQANRCQLSYAGNELEGSARHSLLVGGEVRGNWRDDMDWFMNLDTRYQSKRFISFENSVWMEPYWLADFRIGLKSGDRWSLTAYVDNLFDDDTMKASGVQIQNWNLAYLAVRQVAAHRSRHRRPAAPAPRCPIAGNSVCVRLSISGGEEPAPAQTG